MPTLAKRPPACVPKPAGTLTHPAPGHLHLELWRQGELGSIHPWLELDKPTSPLTLGVFSSEIWEEKGYLAGLLQIKP